MNADFPPLSTSVMSNHQQKQAEPPVAARQEKKEELPCPSEDEEAAAETSTQGTQSPVTAETDLNHEDHPSEDLGSTSEEVSPTENTIALLEKFHEVPAAPEEEEEHLEEVRIEESSSAPVVVDNVEAATSSLAVGTRPFKATTSQPNQQVWYCIDYIVELKYVAVLMIFLFFLFRFLNSRVPSPLPKFCPLPVNQTRLPTLLRYQGGILEPLDLQPEEVAFPPLPLRGSSHMVQFLV